MKRLLQPSIIFPCLFAFFAWGGWAYYINLQMGDASQALRSALAQGFYSGAMTFYMSLSVHFFFVRSQKMSVPSLRFLWPSVATIGHAGAVLVLLHYLNHTPNIALTVVAPLSVASLYCLFLTKRFGARTISNSNFKSID
jgi:hypothetical protein